MSVRAHMPGVMSLRTSRPHYSAPSSFRALALLFVAQLAACSADTGNPADAVRPKNTKPSPTSAGQDAGERDAGTDAGVDAGLGVEASSPNTSDLGVEAGSPQASALDGSVQQRVDASPVVPEPDTGVSTSDGEASGSGDAALEPAPSATDVEVEPVPSEDQCVAARYVFAPDIVNARDLGGVPLAQGTTSCGTLFRGPPLAALSTERCDEFVEHGIRTVIDLRIESERTTKPDATCVTDQANVVLAPLPVPYEVSPENYVTDLNTVDSMSAIFHTLGDPAAYPVYMHCTWGRDRTGVVAAAVLLAVGASAEAIHAEYVLSGDSVGAYPASLQGVLDEIEARGGVEAYLAELGISAAEIAVLRERLASSE